MCGELLVYHACMNDWVNQRRQSGMWAPAWILSTRDHSLLPAAVYLRIQRQVRTLLNGHTHVAFLATALCMVVCDYLDPQLPILNGT
jgi:hypothetical protein